MATKAGRGPTAYLNVQYKKAVTQYKVYVIVTTFSRKKENDRKIYFSGKMFDLDQNVVAECEALFVLVDDKVITSKSKL